jgi:hypothetical protein
MRAWSLGHNEEDGCDVNGWTNKKEPERTTKNSLQVTSWPVVYIHNSSFVCGDYDSLIRAGSATSVGLVMRHTQ